MSDYQNLNAAGQYGSPANTTAPRTPGSALQSALSQLQHAKELADVIESHVFGPEPKAVEGGNPLGSQPHIRQTAFALDDGLGNLIGALNRIASALAL